MQTPADKKSSKFESPDGRKSGTAGKDLSPYGPNSDSLGVSQQRSISQGRKSDVLAGPGMKEAPANVDMSKSMPPQRGKNPFDVPGSNTSQISPSPARTS